MDQVPISKQLKLYEALGVTWSGEERICSEGVKHYPAFLCGKNTTAVSSFVLMTSEDEQKQFLAYLEDLYEDNKGEKMVRVRWFYHNEEVKNVIPELNDAQPNEVFITPHVQDRINVKSIANAATVLTPDHYEKCSAILPKELSSSIFICHREFKCNKKIIKPFPISKLRGYDTQELLCRNLFSFLLEQHSDDSIEEKQSPPSVGPTRQSSHRRARSQRRKCTKPERFCSVMILANSSILENRTEDSEPPLGPVSNQVDGVEPSRVSSSKFDQENQHIELLCQDSGIRDCWFKCKILRVSKSNIRVQYFDIEDAEGTGKLEEWIPATRVALPDTLGIRCHGRLTVRPWQPVHYMSESAFEVGDAVDAWRGDGWWEGIVISLDNNSGSDKLEVYFPGENKFLTLQRKDLRPSRDWVDQKWVKVEAKRDTLSFISSLRSAKASKLTVFENRNQIRKLPSSAASAEPKKDVRLLPPKKRLCINSADQVIFKGPNFSPNVSDAKDTNCQPAQIGTPAAIVVD